MRQPDFSPDTLMARASARTGFNDFGPPEMSQPLARLTAAIERESNLTPVGALAIHTHLVDLLETRLRVHAAYCANPAIRREPVDRPIFVLGLPRTGTTLLHNLIARDCSVRVPATWEVMDPCPSPATDSPANIERRIRRVARRLAWVDRLAPDFKRIHPVGAELPQECIAITAHAFESIEFHTTNDVGSYQRWLEGTDHRGAYQWHRYLLQHLQYGQTPRRWVLKAPGHLYSLEGLFAQYPDARVVQTHRDPLEVVGSIASHGTVLRAAFARGVDPHRVAREWADSWAGALDRSLAFRDQHPQLAKQFTDLNYRDLVSNPLQAVGRVYAHGQVDLSQPARLSMSAYLSANPQNKHGKHTYTLAQYGLNAAQMRKRFEAYVQRYELDISA